MKKLLIISILCLGSLAFADEDAIKRQSPEGYSDEYAPLNADAPQTAPADGARKPSSSGDLPYSDDEIQQNAPENYKSKNMPIDQD